MYLGFLKAHDQVCLGWSRKQQRKARCGGRSLLNLEELVEGIQRRGNDILGLEGGVFTEQKHQAARYGLEAASGR